LTSTGDLMETVMREKIKEILEGIIQKKVSIETGFLDTGLLDSLLTMQLVENLEKEFDIRISNDDFTHFNFNSLDALEKLVKGTH
jgi:acyl carrier protein